MDGCWSGKRPSHLTLGVLIVMICMAGVAEVEAQIPICFTLLLCVGKSPAKSGPYLPLPICIQLPLPVAEPPHDAFDGCRNACALNTVLCGFGCAPSGPANFTTCIHGCVEAADSCVQSCGGEQVEGLAPPPFYGPIEDAQ